MSEKGWPEIASPIRKFGDRRYDEFEFDRPFFEKLADWIGCSKGEDSILSLREPHYFALQGYYRGKADFAGQVKRADEENALETIKQCADALWFALDDLSEVGRAQDKLIEGIQTHPFNQESPDDYLLSKLLGHPVIDPFSGLETLLRDISVAAERAIASPPPKSPREPLIPSPDTKREIIRENFTRSIANRSYKDSPQTVFKRIKTEHRLPKDYAILMFLVQFKPLWKKLSPHTFTEGKHHEREGYISHTVMAVKYCLDKQGESHTQSEIGSAIKKIKYLHVEDAE